MSKERPELSRTRKRPVSYRGDGIIRRSWHNLPGTGGLQRPYSLISARPHRVGDARGSGRDRGFARIRESVHRFLADETKAGLLLISVALFALFVANSPFQDAFLELAHTKIGPAALGLNMSIEHWAADGLLTIFFFVVGLELKTEFVTGALRDMREAALPMIAAAFGMIGPALVYVTIQAAANGNAYHGWAVPTATDIAFAVALLGIFGRGLPPAARTFLLTLAVVDDLLAIIIIAAFYSTSLDFVALGLSIATIAVFAALVNRRITSPWLLIPLALVAWGLMFNSGVHATIAGVALGLVVPARRVGNSQMTHDFVRKVHPWSAGVALPIFALFAAGVPVLGAEGGLSAALADPITFSIAIALPLGKVLGIWGSVALLTKWTRLRLGNGVDLPDVAAISLLAGIGFTVAMLVAGLAFTDPTEVFHGRFGVILGTFASAALAALALHHRTRVRARGTRA